MKDYKHILKKRTQPQEGIICNRFFLVRCNLALPCKPLSKLNVWALRIMVIVDKQMQDHFVNCSNMFSISPRHLSTQHSELPSFF